MLTAWPDFHRATLKFKCQGLTPVQIRTRAVPSSTLALLGLVRHMADVERSWFRRIFHGEELPNIWSDDDRDAGFRADSADVDEAFARWSAECDRAREIVASAKSLDEEGFHRRTGAIISLRWIIIHLKEECARHSGHADLLRECLIERPANSARRGFRTTSTGR